MSSDKTVSSWLAAGLLAAAAALVIQTVDPAIAAAEPLTVKRVIAIALENNPELLAARQEIENSRAREVKAHYLNQFNPQVEGGASNAHFEAVYGAIGERAILPATEVTLMIHPLRFCRIRGTTA